MASRRLLLRAARLLEEHAALIWRSCVNGMPGHPNYGKIDDPDAQNDYDDLVRTAKALREAA